MFNQEKLVELLDRSNKATGRMHRPLTHLCLGGQSRSVVQAAAARGIENTIIKMEHTAQIALTT